MQERRPVLEALKPAGSRRFRRLLIPAVAALVVAADQTTKSWALHQLQSPRHVIGPVYFELTFNRGAAFSLGSGIGPVVETVVVVIVIWLLAFSRRISRNASLATIVGLGLLLGGALGNLGDRFFRDVPGHPGAVIDFIQAVSWWPVFNIADACIVIGVIVVVLSYARRR